MSMVQRITNYLKAGYPGLAIETTEEQRACADVIAAATAAEKGVAVWSATDGLRRVHPDVANVDQTDYLDAACAQRFPETVYIILDAQTWPVDRDPKLVRTIRDLLAWAPSAGSCVVFLGAAFKGHASFERFVSVLDYSLPSASDLRTIAENIRESAGKTANECPISNLEIRALGGLSTSEAENALALSLVETECFDAGVIYREKIAAVKKSGLLEIVDPDPRGLDAIGGLEALKDWITKRRRAYTPEAEAFGLPLPKGILLVGVPGTGKSLSARAIGTALGVPTLKLDIGSLYGSLVGESEQRTRDALALAEAMAPCVLWVDEIDKGLAGASGSGSNDSGVTRRVFGTVITWMQERKRPVFLVATANQVDGLPPEFLRKGRFDELFAVDLPNPTERAAILGIQMRRVKQTDIKANPLSLNDVIVATEGFTGSEIENLVNEAMFEAFSRGGKNNRLTIPDLVAAAKATVPLSVTAKEQIQTIRKWAETRARFASAPVAAEPAKAPGVRKLRKETV